jgi:hypothetical protein
MNRVAEKPRRALRVEILNSNANHLKHALLQRRNRCAEAAQRVELNFANTRAFQRFRRTRIFVGADAVEAENFARIIKPSDLFLAGIGNAVAFKGASAHDVNSGERIALAIQVRAFSQRATALHDVLKLLDFVVGHC